MVSAKIKRQHLKATDCLISVFSHTSGVITVGGPFQSIHQGLGRAFEALVNIMLHTLFGRYLKTIPYFISVYSTADIVTVNLHLFMRAWEQHGRPFCEIT